LKTGIPKYTVLILLAVITTSNGQSIIDHLNGTKTQVTNEIFDTNNVIDEVNNISAHNAPSKMTRKIRNDNDGNLLFSSYVDVIRYDGTSFTKFKKQDGLDSFDAFDVMQDSNGGTWVASTHFGLFYYPAPAGIKSGDKTFYHFTSKNGLVHDRTMSLYEDRAGGIWIGAGGGLSYYDGKAKLNGQISFRNFTEKDGLTNSSVNTIMEDKSGNIWVGTRGTVSMYNPLAKFKKGELPFKEVKNDAGRPFENVWSIIEDINGNIWLGGQYGLWRYDGYSYTHLTSVSTQYVYEDKKGIIWFTHGADATHSIGLSYYDQNSLLGSTPKATQVYSGGGMLWGIAEDKDGAIWVGKLDGVFRYDGKSVNYFIDEYLKKY